MSQFVHPSLRGRVAVLLATLLGALVTAVGAQAAPSAFYASPSPLPDGGPGTLIRSQPFSFNRAVVKPPVGTTAFRLLYLSTGASGERTVVSGTLLLPAGGAAGKPIVSVAVGMHGMGDSCGPSQQLETSAEPDLATMASLLRRGFAVAVTDYQGVGTAGDHLFGVNRVLGRNVLDVVRAARQVPGTGLAADGPVGITGYSEGGGAAGSAIEQAPTYAPDLDLKGGVAGGMLADPARALRLLNGNWFFALEMAGLIGYDEAYPDVHLGSYLNSWGAWTVKHDTDACATFVARFIFNRLSWYTSRSPLQSPALKAHLTENTVGNLRPSVPVYLYHGRFDEALMVDQTAGVRDRWCAQGVNVKFVLNPVGEHFTTQLLEEPKALSWLAARLAGEPAPKGSC